MVQWEFLRCAAGGRVRHPRRGQGHKGPLGAGAEGGGLGGWVGRLAFISVLQDAVGSCVLSNYFFILLGGGTR